MSATLENNFPQIGNIQNLLSTFLAKTSYSQLVVLCDENTHQYCLPLIKNILPENTLIAKIPAGEVSKNIETCQLVWEQMLQKNCDRNACVLNLGGGVVGDLGGFVAAVYKRGIDFVQIPTSLLAQVDASVGGKTGIDFQGAKNILGSFAQPQKVLIDVAFLQTLPLRHLYNAWFEMLKHALIADAAYWQELTNQRPEDIADWTSLIEQSIAIKYEVVRLDPLEKSWRKILNFGHTVGHAVESWALQQQMDILHGEAVGIGMIAELYLSHKLLHFSEEKMWTCAKQIKKYLPKIILQPQSFTEILHWSMYDKKNAQGEIMAALITDIGKAQPQCVVCAVDFEAALVFYNKVIQYE
ncbi:MAG: 3-dehydroquinate synthase [Chitinophagales bacterium]|nr:3-dehydroquinate synthase [Bacteroidota bacterium]MCB9042632.1 3-dehydroquinate synthase [Chitinophagales bacterium]